MTSLAVDSLCLISFELSLSSSAPLYCHYSVQRVGEGADAKSLHFEISRFLHSFTSCFHCTFYSFRTLIFFEDTVFQLHFKKFVVFQHH